MEEPPPEVLEMLRCRRRGRGRGRYRIPGARSPLEESLPPAEYQPMPPLNPTGEPMITAPRPYRLKPYDPLNPYEDIVNPVIYPPSSARIGSEKKPEACPVSKEGKTNAAPGAQFKGNPKCDEICFSVSTKDYPNVKDILGNTVPKPPSGIYELPSPYIRTNKDYRSIYRRSTGVNPSGAEVHHILPGWAGGRNDASNLAALAKGHMGKGSLHEWWKNKIKEKAPSINNKMAQCAKQNGASGAAIVQCQIGVGNKYPVGSSSAISLSEPGIARAAHCLGDKDVKLKMAIDQPCIK